MEQILPVLGLTSLLSAFDLWSLLVWHTDDCLRSHTDEEVHVRARHMKVMETVMLSDLLGWGKYFPW